MGEIYCFASVLVPVSVSVSVGVPLSCERDIFLRVRVIISKFGMLIGLIKTSDEFEDEPSGTSLRALKTLTSKKLVNTITL